MLFSGLSAQSEISQLLDELYGRLDHASLGSTGGRERHISQWRRSAELPWEAQERTRGGEYRELRAKGQAA